MWRGRSWEGVRRMLGLGALGAGRGAGALLRVSRGDGMRQRADVVERGVSQSEPKRGEMEKFCTELQLSPLG